MKNESNKLPKGLVRTIAFGFFLIFAVTVLGGFLSQLALGSGMQP
jgi:hypothetical protein